MFRLLHVYFDFTYSGLHRCIVFFLLIVSLLHYLAIQPSRLQVCRNKISYQLSHHYSRVLFPLLSVDAPLICMTV